MTDTLDFARTAAVVSPTAQGADFRKKSATSPGRSAPRGTTASVWNGARKAFAKPERGEAATTVKRLGRAQILDSVEELALVEAWKVRRDAKALDRLCRCYEPLIRRLAVKASRTLNLDDREDVFQAGREEFIVALEKFDATRGFRLGTFAATRIAPGLIRARAETTDLVNIRKAARIRLACSKLPEMLRAARAVEGHDLPPATRQAIATALNLSVEETDWLERRLFPYDLSLSSEPGADEEDGRSTARIAGALIDPSPSPEERMMAGRAKADVAARNDRLRALIANLPERERRVIETLFCANGTAPTMAEMGVAMGVSRERVRQIQNQALLRLRAMIAEGGIDKDDWLRPSLVEDLAA